MLARSYKPCCDITLRMNCVPFWRRNMANVKQGQLVRPPEWLTSLRLWVTRLFWKRERKAAQKDAVVCAVASHAASRASVRSNHNASRLLSARP
jgi:hypothetical protein